MKSKLEIYALAVCFSSVVCLVIASGIFGYAVFEILAPKMTMSSYQYNRYQTNESYWKDTKPRCSKKDKETERPNDEELTKQRLEAFSRVVEGEKRKGFQSLIRSLIFILVGTVVLFIHWRLAKTSRE